MTAADGPAGPRSDVTVVTVTYNAAGLVLDALAGLAAQTSAGHPMRVVAQIVIY